MELFHATNQWAQRPNDQRFSSLQAIHDAVDGYRQRAVVRSVQYTSINVRQDGSEVVITGPQGGAARLSHWAFGQLAARADAPAHYLRTLPAALAVTNLQHGLSKRSDDATASILFHNNGGLLTRAFNGDAYSRIWNADITARLLRLEADGPWQPAPAAFDGSRGLYASDHDMFCFLVDNNRRIFESLPGGGLSRGFFVANSEVGAAKFWLLSFWYEWICGNHRIVGATRVQELSVRHVGDANRRMSGFIGEFTQYAESSGRDDEAKIQRARTIRLGDDKDALLDKVFRLRIPALTRKAIEAGYERAALPESRDKYGDPLTAWGFTGGLTEVARDLPYADERVALDRAAGKVLEVVF